MWNCKIKSAVTQCVNRSKPKPEHNRHSKLERAEMKKKYINTVCTLKDVMFGRGKAELKEYQIRSVYTRASIRHLCTKSREYKAGWWENNAVDLYFGVARSDLSRKRYYLLLPQNIFLSVTQNRPFMDICQFLSILRL